jgi:HD-GYP domain-containing protein (c-di-GMP phosphodiesterase class II)
MTTDRAYREALSAEAAIAELRRCAGAQFDARVVEAFRSALAESGPAGGRLVGALD